MKAKRAADVLGQVLKKNSLERGLKRGRALVLWPEIAGPGLAELSDAERLEDGVLFVRVSDSVVGHQLTYLRSEFVRRYQERLPGLVHELRFQVGQAEAKPKAPPPKSQPPRLSLEEEHDLRNLAQQVPQELQSAVLRAGKALKQHHKQNALPPCAVCAAPSPHSPCASCQKLMGENTVTREAKRLEKFPLKHRLEGQPQSVARYLALSKLEGQLRELLPEVVRQPELLPMLQDTARRYLQLRTGEAQVSGQRGLLPPALQSLLREL